MADDAAAWVAPLAATGLAVVMFLATGYHIRAGELLRREYRNAATTALLCSLLIAAAYAFRPH